VLESVVNLSEGRRGDVIDRIAAAAGSSLLDVHSDPHHHRSVLTLGGPNVEDAARAVSSSAVAEIDLRAHAGAHPRMGAVDVVPFVPLGPLTNEECDLTDALQARDDFASWAGRDLGLPCYLYGPERSLPEVRRRAFRELSPDTGPDEPHPTAGATAVGARGPLVAYNLWLAEPNPSLARAIAVELRSAAVRALGLDVGGRAQVSINLVEPLNVGPAAVFDVVARRTEIERAELVGLLPAAVLAKIPSRRWAELDLGASRTIEARLESAGIHP
jgi:glutamate formiminotransferase